MLHPARHEKSGAPDKPKPVRRRRTWFREVMSVPPPDRELLCTSVQAASNSGIYKINRARIRMEVMRARLERIAKS
jgi:hypothetical protein